MNDASEAKLVKRDSHLYIEANGYIGGVQMTLQHGADFSIEMTDRALFADYLTTGNKTRLLVITPETDELFSYSGDFEITEVIVANSQNEVPTSLPVLYSLSAAYPNPFNPVTTIQFALPVDTKISIDIYDMRGRFVETLIDRNMLGGYHSMIWNGSSYSSGIYFIKMQAGSYIRTQKLMLIK